MRVLLSCVNTLVSLIGYDLEKQESFWYCPSNILRACGACVHQQALWIADHGTITKIDATGLKTMNLPGPHANYAHSIHSLNENFVGVADTGNSRLVFVTNDNTLAPLSFSPLEEWQEVPEDAIHLNDFATWRDGVIVSAFHYQPFARWRHSDLAWRREGWGAIFYIKRYKGKSLSRIIACGLDCPHTLITHGEEICCCSSYRGEFYRFLPDERGTLQQIERKHITSDHFLRGALRLKDAWLFGGSSFRKGDANSNMSLYLMPDSGKIERMLVAGAGEIYDILPWDDAIMPQITDVLAKLPKIADAEGDFPEKCILPDAYRKPENK